ncbi:Major centromere autoantigen B [Cytospora mali]|uniref:Major centromere autoantigen B n=1 Tax=Cytospora mali TaxID=578113 RepID=A0A194VM29_CYTMA|nr:Major centromere autoantigen B [Valsa mali]
MPEYGGGFGYLAPMSHGLPSESLGRMPPPATSPQQPLPQQQQQQQQQQHSQTSPPHHPTLPMLMVPSHPTWPSMLTNPNSYNSSPPVAIQPASAPPLKTTRPAIPPIASQPRKTLTDDDRRRMCQYHIDHPSMKQTEIGALFGVERSTVSKVLSRKDKWLNPEDRSNSPIKKTKGKIPDIDKTLANWLRNEQHKGRHVSDAEIQEQARMYARPFREAENKINNPSWLEKFKQKHGMGGRLLRRASETNIPRAAGKIATTSPVLTNSQPSSAISSDSPVHHQSVSPFSAGPRDGVEEEKESSGGAGSGGMMLDFSEPPSTSTGSTFKFNSTNQSTTSLGSGFASDTAGSSFSDNTMSPTGTGQFTFSPDPNVGGFLSAEHHAQAGHMPPGGPNFQRPRSQTFPTLDLEYMNQGGNESNDPLTPKYVQGSQGVPSTAPSSALESPAHEFGGSGPFGIDNAIASPHHQPQHALHHSSSASSLQGRHQGAGGTTPIIGSGALSSVASSPVSPTQEDARRAADTLLSFIAHSGPNSLVDQSDYNAVIRLTDKLRLHQQAQQQAAARVQSGLGMGAMGGMAMGLGMGGLDRIPEGDAEMGNTGSHMDEGGMVKHEGTMV